MFEGNSDFVESINTDDELHRIICELVWKYGRGSPVGVVWDASPQHRRRHSGVFVCQLDKGLCVRKFRVLSFPGGFHLFALGKQRNIVAPYFAEEK